MENYMERKLRKINGSLAVTFPKQICNLYKIKNGDMLEIETIGFAELRIRKKHHDDRDIGELTEMAYYAPNKRK